MTMTLSHRNDVSHWLKKIMIFGRNPLSSLNAQPWTVKIVFALLLFFSLWSHTVTAPTAPILELFKCTMSGRSDFRILNKETKERTSFAKFMSLSKNLILTVFMPELSNFSKRGPDPPAATRTSKSDEGKAVARSCTYLCAPPQTDFVITNKTFLGIFTV